MRRPCPHHGCTAAVARSDLVRHAGSCPFRPEALAKAREEKQQKLRETQRALEAEARGASAAQRLRIGQDLLQVCRQLQEAGVKLNEVAISFQPPREGRLHSHSLRISDFADCSTWRRLCSA